MHLKVLSSLLIKIHNKFIKTPNFLIKQSQFSTMSDDWKETKAKYLSMNISDKRKEYAKPKYITIEDIEAWPEYLKNNENNTEAIPRLSTHEIDETLNKIVAQKVSVFHGDITTLEIDAIVNAANESLLGGGGVDGAIHKAAGHFLKAENRTHVRCEVGNAKISGGYKLPAKYVISTVGPKGEKPKDLASCYKKSLKVMLDNSLRSIAFPCISTGIYGYPNDAAAPVAIYEVRKFLENNHENVDRVIFCIFMDVDKHIYNGMLQSYFPLT